MDLSKVWHAPSQELEHSRAQPAVFPSTAGEGGKIARSVPNPYESYADAASLSVIDQWLALP